MLRVSDLSYCFDQVEVLRGVSFDVEAGELFGIMGPSGVGKSTILRLIAGLLKPPRKSVVEVAGEDVRDLPVARRPLSYMQQGFPLYKNLSVLENVVVGSNRKNDTDLRARSLLKLLGLPERLWDEQPLFLSGGEAQRVALGKALLKDADVLLLDEPFSNLDKETKVKLAHLVRKRVKELGCAAVVISHAESDLALLVDRVGVVGHGRFAQVGTLEELWQSPKSIQAAAIGSVVGLQSLKRAELPKNRRWDFPDEVVQVAWRAEASSVEAELPEDSDCKTGLCLEVQVIRSFRFGGRYLLELSLDHGNGRCVLWHVANTRAELDGECILRVPKEELRKIGEEGHLEMLVNDNTPANESGVGE